MELKMCPVCNSNMNYNAEGKAKNAKAPDWKCTKPECKFSFNKKTGNWEPSDFRTGVWNNDKFEKPVVNTIIAKNEVITPALKEYNNGKTDSMKELNAKKLAGEYANIMLQLGLITPQGWKETFEEKAREIYNFTCVPF